MVVIPSKMGLLNRRALLHCLKNLGSASRADLAKESKLSQPTVGKITDDFIRRGIVQEIGPVMPEGVPSRSKPRARNKAGRPGRVLRLEQTRPRFLGIHLDVSETRFALLPLQALPQDVWNWSARTPLDLAGWGNLLREAPKHLNLSTSDLLGVILCVPGIVDEVSGKVLFSPNLHWTEHVSLPALVHEVWRLPVVLMQEIRALALGQNSLNHRGEDFLLVDIGEGVGSAAILDGQSYNNRLPLSGEIGHTRVVGNDRVCGCGATGCLETLVSRSGLLQSYGQHSGTPTDDLMELKRHVEPLPTWMRDTLDATGAVVAGALNVLGIKKVLITGLLNEFGEEVHQCLARSISKGALWDRFGEVECIFASRHRTAGMTATGIDRLVVPAPSTLTTTHLPAGQVLTDD